MVKLLRIAHIISSDTFRVISYNFFRLVVNEVINEYYIMKTTICPDTLLPPPRLMSGIHFSSRPPPVSQLSHLSHILSLSWSSSSLSTSPVRGSIVCQPSYTEVTHSSLPHACAPVFSPCLGELECVELRREVELCHICLVSLAIFWNLLL